jgi:hypothetical protein
VIADEALQDLVCDLQDEFGGSPRWQQLEDHVRRIEVERDELRRAAADGGCRGAVGGPVSAGGEVIAEPLIHWPNRLTDRMTPEQVDAWVDAAVEAGRRQAQELRASYYEEQRAHLREAIRALEAQLAELDVAEAAEVTTFDVDCPVCGDYGGLGEPDPEYPDHWTVREHIEERRDGCDPERWGKTVPLATVLAHPEDYNLKDGDWQIINGTAG